MIIKQTPVERRLWASGAIGTDKSEGKLVKASADGNGGDLVRMSHPGIVQVRLNDTPGTIEDGTDLVACADATVKAATGAAGEVVVAKSVAPNTSGQGGCLHDAILVARPAATPEAASDNS